MKIENLLLNKFGDLSQREKDIVDSVLDISIKEIDKNLKKVFTWSEKTALNQIKNSLILLQANEN